MRAAGLVSPRPSPRDPWLWGQRAVGHARSLCQPQGTRRQLLPGCRPPSCPESTGTSVSAGRCVGEGGAGPRGLGTPPQGSAPPRTALAGVERPPERAAGGALPGGARVRVRAGCSPGPATPGTGPLPQAGPSAPPPGAATEHPPAPARKASSCPRCGPGAPLGRRRSASSLATRPTRPLSSPPRRPLCRTHLVSVVTASCPQFPHHTAWGLARHSTDEGAR